VGNDQADFSLLSPGRGRLLQLEQSHMATCQELNCVFNKKIYKPHMKEVVEKTVFMTGKLHLTFGIKFSVRTVVIHLALGHKILFLQLSLTF
jgi:hypothetical protein